MERKTMTLDEFQTAVRAQGVAAEDYAFRCPMCRTVQSAADFIAAGAGPDLESVSNHLGFSCIGRFTHRESPPRPIPEGFDKGCNWTLGGLFQMHELEVLTPDGVKHRHFEPCTPEEAQQHAAKRVSFAAGQTT